MLRLTLLITLILTLSGCATYRQDIDEGLLLAKSGDWQGAETVIDKALERRDTRPCAEHNYWSRVRLWHSEHGRRSQLDRDIRTNR